MAAYAVIARIGRVDPHLVVGDVERRDDPPDRGVPIAIDAAVAVEDTVPYETFGDRIQRARERWAQLTFFLFDPESWRT